MTIKKINTMNKLELRDEITRLHTVIDSLYRNNNKADSRYDKLKVEYVKLQQHDATHRESIRIIGKLYK